MLQAVASTNVATKNEEKRKQKFLRWGAVASYFI